jgi:phospholipase/carboxylesterase
MLQTELIKAANSEAKDLLVALHGLGDSMEGYRWLPSALRMPDVNVLLVNAPDAYYGGFSWYDFAGDPAPGVERSYRLMESMLDGLAEKGFSAERAVLFGFSQGCLMCFEAGLRYQRRFAGIIGVSGYVHEPERLLKLASPVAKDQKFLITHGTLDTLIPSRLVQPQIAQLRKFGLAIEFHEFEKDHTIIEPEIELFRNWIAGRLGLPVNA